MLRLVYSDRTEHLLEALLDALRSRRRDPFRPVEILVPNANVGSYVRFGVAQAFGVAANLELSRLERFAGRFVDESTERTFRLVTQERQEGAILSILHDPERLKRPELARVRRYLDGPGGEDGLDLRRAQFAGHLGHLFEEYAYHRPELLAAWRDHTLRDPEDPDEIWQSALWREILGDTGIARAPAGPGEPEGILLAELLRRPERRLGASDAPLHVFGLSYVARVYQDLLALLRERRPVHLYSLNPCVEFWEDVESPRELRNRLRRGREELRVDPDRLEGEEDPYELLKLDPDDNPPLRFWGMPGRENHRLLNQLSDCDYESRFSDPERDPRTLLEALQRDILRREPRRREADPAWTDDSLTLLGCPGVRREVEAVAEEIWRLVRADDGDPPLRFHDIAVIVNHPAREEYLPHVEAVFREVHDLPISVGDLPLAGHDRAVEAARLLLELPFGRFGRHEMVRILAHPAVAGSFEDVGPGDWAALADELGVFFGADAEALAGTYLSPEVGHWDQGLRRLAMGAFLAGEASGDDRILVTPQGETLAADAGARDIEPRARFGLLARSLLADAAVIRSRRLPPTAWAALFRRQLEAYLWAPDLESARLACIRALGRLEEMDVDERPVSGRTATALAAAALSRLEGRHGHPLAEGVVVSSFLPMRAIPFRVVFLLGLGEGRFPAPQRRDALDLRARRRRAGDVTPAERDRYMFLETLLSTRERLRISWVDRDPTSGETLLPSSVVQQLLRMLEEGYVEDLDAVLSRLALRRHEAVRAPSRPGAPGLVDPEAGAEARARALGRPYRDRDTAWRLLDNLGSRDEPVARSLRSLLRLEPLPRAEPAAGDDRPLELSVSNLRDFLLSPLQTWGRVVAGLGEVEDEGIDPTDAEPTEAGHLLSATLPRTAFLDAVCTGVEARPALDGLLRRHRLAGELPSGVLARLTGEPLHEDLAAWLLLRERHLGGRPYVRARLGRASERDRFERLLPSVELSLDLPTGTRRVRLYGRLEALAADGGATLMARGRSKEKVDPNDVASKRARWGLQATLEHFVLAAAGVEPDRDRRLDLLVSRPEGGAPSEPTLFRLPLRAVSREEALDTLRTLASELLSRPHAYLLPGEALLAVGPGGLGDGEKIVGQIRRRAIYGRGEWSCRWGDVPRPETYPVPSPEEAAAMAERRFRALLEHQAPWERHT